MSESKRLIEDYLPIEAISAEASREKSVRDGHISTLHLWWARRPLVACRAAVYGALVPASRFVPNAGTDEKKKSLGRANAAKFVKALCQYPASHATINEARQHILEAHANRLSEEGKKKVSVEDIVLGKAPRPRVLDMFSGGGAIPLEALRLGCETRASDLNPVAHIIQLCTLVYPQKYGKIDASNPGATGEKGANGKTTWGGLASELRFWGEWMRKKIQTEIGDLYPLIPDPAIKGKKQATQRDLLKECDTAKVSAGYLIPVAYLWTRTVTCKNPSCGAVVPLLKQTWLCKKKERYVALRVIAPRGKKTVRFEVVETRSESALGFNPASFSTGGNATCPFCRTVSDSDYVKGEGCHGRMGHQMMAIVCTRPGHKGKIYFSAETLPAFIPDDDAIRVRIGRLCRKTGMTVPEEPIVDDAKSSFWIRLYGVTTYGQLFSPRQLLGQLSLCAQVNQIGNELERYGYEKGRAAAIQTYLGVMVDKLADFSSMECTWNYTGGRGVRNGFTRQALPMVWDYAESNIFNPAAASWIAILKDTPAVIEEITSSPMLPAEVVRGDATKLSIDTGSIDAVVTDPPYYDNVSYADLSDFFYVWLKRSVAKLHPEHFAGTGTPKRTEAVADATRHNGDGERARSAYERMMLVAFQEVARVLKADGNVVVVYAHKTTLGWSTLVDALRRAGFMITEAWPLDTERKSRMTAMNTSALASSIFLSARKREETATASFEEQVKPELERIVVERVETLWAMRVSGANLVIACVGAGLRAFTRVARVEYASGEEVPAERFLMEVESVVLEAILARLSKEVGGNADRASLSGLDAATRFYVLWRYTYGWGDLDAGEAIIFANGTHVELDGSEGLSTGSNAVLNKTKGKYQLRDFADRGEENDLGMPDASGNASSVIDALHRLLWLQKRRAPLIPEFLSGARHNLEQLRLVAQSLAGPALKGGELKNVSPTEEQLELGKLLANWQAVVEGKEAGERRQTGQRKLL